MVPGGDWERGQGIRLTPSVIFPVLSRRQGAASPESQRSLRSLLRALGSLVFPEAATQRVRGLK